MFREEERGGLSGWLPVCSQREGVWLLLLGNHDALVWMSLEVEKHPEISSKQLWPLRAVGWVSLGLCSSLGPGFKQYWTFFTYFICALLSLSGAMGKNGVATKVQTPPICHSSKCTEYLKYLKYFFNPGCVGAKCSAKTHTSLPGLFIASHCVVQSRFPSQTLLLATVGTNPEPLIGQTGSVCGRTFYDRHQKHLFPLTP